MKLLKAVWVGRLLGAGTVVGDDAEEEITDFLLGLPETICVMVKDESPAPPAVEVPVVDIAKEEAGQLNEGIKETVIVDGKRARRVQSSAD